MAKYSDFKSYLQEKYIYELTRSINAYINGTYDSLKENSIDVLPIYDYKIENVKIKTLRCHEDVADFIKMEIHCVADILKSDFGTENDEINRITKWFTVYAQAMLVNGLREFCINSVVESGADKFIKEDIFHEYLVPAIYSDQLEDEADNFCQLYCKGALYDGYRTPLEYILNVWGVEYYEASLPKNVFGRMYFKSSMEEVYEYTPYIIQRINGKREKHLIKKKIKAGTILVNVENHFMNDVGSVLNTIAHEIIHWEKHRKFFEILSLLNEEEDSLSCAVDPEMTSSNLEGAEKAIWWAEWQANVLAPRILMPRLMFLDLFKQIYEEQSQIPYFQNGDIIERTIEKLGLCFGVSKYAAKIRAIQLGIDIAEGAYIFVDKQYYPPITFSLGTLSKNQTFIIDRDSAQKMIECNESLKQLIENDAIIYTGSVFCINNPKYIKKDQSNVKVEYKLTRYALEHADECCLIFTKSFSRDNASIEAELYSEFYLARNVTASIYVEPHYDPEFEHNQSIEELAIEMKQFMEARKKERDIIKQLPDNFSETLKEHMKRRGISIIDLAYRSNLSDTTIKNYRSGKVQPNIDNLMAVFIGLNLSEKYCNDMLNKAGYKLNDSDLHGVYRFLLDNHLDGTLEQWNDVLVASGFEKIPKK